MRLLGRAIQVPDGLTATLDLAIASDSHNLLVCDEHGKLTTSTRFAGPRR